MTTMPPAYNDLGKLLSAVDALVRAVDFKGKEPIIHDDIHNRHQKEWPTLWRAIALIRQARQTFPPLEPDLSFPALALSLSVTRTPVKRQEEQDPAVAHPSHYGGDTVYEAIKVIRAWGLGFNAGNAAKYICRAGKKDPAKLLEDLKKARFYLDDEIKALEKTA